MPRILILTCHKANGVYSTEPTPYSFGKYLHVMKLDFSNFMGSLAAVSKYSGHYATEDPPKGAEIFHVFNFGKGKITYEQDEPDWGLIRNAGSLSLDEGCQNSQETPKRDMYINVSKDFLLAYGPWADRQREIIWKFFFPASYRPLEVPKPDELNPHQANERFLLKVISQTDVRFDLWFSANRIPKVNCFSLIILQSFYTSSLLRLITSKFLASVKTVTCLHGNSSTNQNSERAEEENFTERGIIGHLLTLQPIYTVWTVFCTPLL
ncbi:unnamed protein product [Schistocephalus solidus]|uniref:UPF0183 protein n=1 Tax=Schistocephalus solidus TaxID=70667 RepID=A0A183TMY8_SCHSO|nr:unnamed protein product [Schistocephalus solidus]